VIADAAGHVVHLGERDCSVQRRHQKIVEESPSPAVDPVLRERLGQAATAVAREIGYVGAGTVEFLLDPAAQFYFMEMNTRLQVEHPVTELVTGLDLVELQLRIARGESLTFAQQDVRLEGHAVEVRLCAEEPADDFLPRMGTVLDWRADELVRCDHAIAPGLPVSPYYDSMLAKVIAHGTTRGEALDRLARALDRTVLLGVASNRAFLARVLRQPDFADGVAVSTAFIERHFPLAADRATAPDDRTWALAAWLSVAAAPETGSTAAEWRNWTTGRPLPAPWRLDWQAPQSQGGPGSARAGRILLEPAGATVLDGERRVKVQGRVVAGCCDGQVEIDGTALPYRYAWHGRALWVHTRAADFQFQCRRRESLRQADAETAASGDLRATINGRVVQFAVAEGELVAPGQRVLVLEAMKMEHDVRACAGGRVAAVAVRLGDQVAPGQLLVRIERGQ
jgi:geranyl-CoA carboxylase alpha subunit